ncbi:spermine/spermidine synthase domain-containing protein [Stenotrophomonas humi]
MAKVGRKGGVGAPYVRHSWRYTELLFRGEVTQTRMLRWFPYWLQVGYTRTMLAALLFNPRPPRIGIVGLGGGAQAKFCHRHLAHSRIEAVESDPRVLALRSAFRIPPDDARLSVECADGAAWLRARPNSFDLLLIDAYDVDGIPAALSSQAFHDSCAAALTPNGVMTSNLYATDTERYLTRMQRAFAGQVCMLAEPAQDNAVVFAWRGQHRNVDAQEALSALPWAARLQLSTPMRRLEGTLGKHV